MAEILLPRAYLPEVVVTALVTSEIVGAQLADLQALMTPLVIDAQALDQTLTATADQLSALVRVLRRASLALHTVVPLEADTLPF